MYFIRRKSACHKAFIPALIFLIGGLSFNLQAQTEIVRIAETDEQKTVAEQKTNDRQTVTRLDLDARPTNELIINKPDSRFRSAELLQPTRRRFNQ